MGGGGSPMTLPVQIEEKLRGVRRFIEQLRKVYKDDLAKWGKPYFTREELIALLYAQNVLDIPDTQLEKLTDISRVTLRKLAEKFAAGKELCYLTEDRERVECAKITLDEVKATVEDWLRPKKPWEVKDIMESEVIRRFLANPVKRSKRARKYHSVRLPDKIVTVILTSYSKVIAKLKERGFRLTNPDVWVDVMKGSTEYGIDKETLQNEVYEAIKEICKESKNYAGCVKEYVVRLRAVPDLYEVGFLKGYAGAADHALRERIAKAGTFEWLTLEDVARLKMHFNASSDGEIKACILITLLHIETGAREGYASTLNRPGDDLDDAKSSLIGLKWENVIFENGRAVGMSIFEAKTESVWRLSRFWLNPEFEELLPKLKEFADKKGYKSIVKTILHYYGLRYESIDAFERWYRVRCMSLIRGITGKNVRPHDIRASHISILADIGVPLEVAVSPQSGFGSGWEDLRTAVMYYWRISEKRLAEYYQLARSAGEKLPRLS
jgi:integrase